nr:MAG TPA: RloB-like protein [Caudoviricetes sp.]
MPREFHKRHKKPVYLFCCEDEKSSRIYLNALKLEYGINIQTITGRYKNPASLRRCLKKEAATYKKDELKRAYCLFDKDDLSMEQFKHEVEETNKKFKAAVSVPCYEYWLLLHLSCTDRSFGSSHECCEKLKDQINRQNNLSLEQLKNRSDIFDLVGGKEGVRRAIVNAKKYNFALGDDPYTNMHEIIEDMLNESGCKL